MAKRTAAHYASMKAAAERRKQIAARGGYIPAPEDMPTRGHSAILKAHGAKWDDEQECWFIIADTAEAILKEIAAAASSRVPLSGDTYPHREALKAAGCKWDNDRRCWTAPDAEIAAAMQALINGETAEPSPSTDVNARLEARAGIKMLVNGWDYDPQTPEMQIEEKMIQLCDAENWDQDEIPLDCLTMAHLLAAEIPEPAAEVIMHILTEEPEIWGQPVTGIRTLNAYIRHALSR